MTRFAIICAFVASVVFPASFARAEDFGARFPELMLPSHGSSPAMTGFSAFSAPSTSAIASAKLGSHFNSQLFVPVASSANRPVATIAGSPASSFVGLSDDLRTALPKSGRYIYELHAPAAAPSATGSLIQPLGLPTLGGSDGNYFRGNFAPFGGANVIRPAGLSYR
jgi:hypothetical protein